MKKLIAFVGKGNYEEVRYLIHGMEIQSRFSFYAVYRIFEPDEVYVISTDEGLKKWFDEIKKIIPNAKKVEITKLSKNSDIWELHRKLDEILNRDDDVAMDITYSFRHIPFITFSSMLYEFRIKGIHIHGIFYGAREAEEERGIPIFDLSGAIDLIRWHYALSAFVKYGRSEELRVIASQLKRAHSIGMYRDSMYGDMAKIMGNLNAISDGLYLNQNLEVLRSCYSLKINIEKYRYSLERFKSIYPPLKDVLNEIEKFVNMGYKNPQGTLTKEILGKLLDVGEYQISINLFGEASSTLREWWISLIIYLCGQVNTWIDRDTREDAALALGAFLKIRKGENNVKKNSAYKCLAEILNEDMLGRIVGLWDKTISIRNLVAHAGMGTTQIKIDRAKEKISNLYKEARSILEVIR